MSSIYNLEPQPTASAIIHTTQGEIALELFAKQTPLTCRNFLQLSLDGYYDNTVFHRLVPGFILQGGDPTGTGQGGESIYDGGAFSGDLDPWPADQRKGQNAGPMGVNFKDEFHSRLKFNRRGLLGMANEGVPDSNGSQFFFTLGKTDELTNKNTVFGRVAGDTIYNLAKMGEAEVAEGTERPLYAMKINRIEVLINPFEDMKKRERKVRHEAPKPAPAEKRQKKRKVGKQLLSFGDEEGDAEDLPVIKKAKFDTRIVMDVDEEPAQTAIPVRTSTNKAAKTQKEARVSEKRGSPPRQSPNVPAPVPAKKAPPPAKTYDSDRSSPEAEEPPKKSLLERTNEEIAAVKASMKRTIHVEPVKETKKSALELMVPETSTRGRKRRPGGNNTSAREEQDALDALKDFRSKLERAPAEKEMARPAGNEGEENGEGDEEGEVCDLHFIANCQSCQAWDKEAKDESDDEGWMSHTLSFVADKLGKDLSYRKKAEEELVVIDPLEKARTLKEDKRASREARVGGSSRAWDRDRDRDREGGRGRDRDRDRRGR
ncbi:cyclophilin-like domain-containing protein [Staphylotrichum tortipilum]|uniref:peptidylprolyl isomerase n=1 Tax=Staphylotrichum tortipilum TaxID=2831512 RepID=A0AAN6MLT0_9PEZI|nr:cyclophilin-like domain-containing protein [Staphylotrichum longicolle]